MGASKKKSKKSKPNSDYDTFPDSGFEKDSAAASAPLLVRLSQQVLSHVLVRVNLYFFLGLALSLIGPQLPSHWQAQFYPASPNNVLNEYLVKLGWAWTLVLALPFALCVGLTYDGLRGLVWNAVRAVVATAVWFVFTGLFRAIRSAYGFDPSGHCFLLLWSQLYLIEEAAAYDGWDLIRADVVDGPRRAKPSGDFVARVRRSVLGLTWPVRLLLLAMAALSVLWDVMFVSTVLFYHTVEEKAVAIAVALLAWLALYRGLYRLPLLPGTPRTQAAQCKAKLEEDAL